MIEGIFLPLITVALAEIGDKTQLTLFCLAAKTRKHLRLFLGAMLAFLIVDGVAVLAGGVVSRLIPMLYIKIFSGLLFVVFGIGFLLQKHEENVSCQLRQPFMSAFSMILFSEMGDKTQITAALFASNYDAHFVLIGIILGLGIISFLTVQFGKHLMSRINSKLLHKISGLIFILLGLSAFFSILWERIF